MVDSKAAIKRPSKVVVCRRSIVTPRCEPGRAVDPGQGVGISLRAVVQTSRKNDASAQAVRYGETAFHHGVAWGRGILADRGLPHLLAIYLQTTHNGIFDVLGNLDAKQIRLIEISRENLKYLRDLKTCGRRNRPLHRA